MREIPDDRVERPQGDRQVAGLAQELPGVEVGPGQLGVVVEHLLEVGHEPAAVGRIAMEAAPELVAEAPGGHRIEGRPEHPIGRRPGIAPVVDDPPKEELDRHRLRELGGPSPATVARIEARLEHGQGGLGRTRRQP